MKKYLAVIMMGLCLSTVSVAVSATGSIYGGQFIKVAEAGSSYVEALKTTMTILKGLNHNPGDSEKSALDEHISAMDGSLNGVALAETMAVVKGLNHFPTDADKARLKKLVSTLRENNGDPHLISLIEIVSNIQHKVSDDDSVKLDDMLAELWIG